MKKIIYTFLILFISINSIVAQHYGKREKLKAYKTAYLTDQLDLSPKEAEKFWPIYNAYEKEYFQLKVNKMSEMRNLIKNQGGFEGLTEKEANQLLSKLSANEQAILDAKKDLFKKLKNIIPAKKVLMLNKAEHDFNRKLLSDYRNKRHMNKEK
ncbi:MAG: sensor of ECF-type sigma factor [Flavobacteriaceae bacterium]|nr:sensor of ECF-type sigma factor [Flavobacteriaceae bacterium]